MSYDGYVISEANKCPEKGKHRGNIPLKSYWIEIQYVVYHKLVLQHNADDTLWVKQRVFA